jgi:hypothetical protein
MAKKKLFNAITGEIDRDEVASQYTKVESLNRFRDEEEFDKVMDIKTRFMEMDKYRQTSCPWYSTVTVLNKNDEIDDSNQSEAAILEQSSSMNWERRWQRDRDLYFMKSGKNRFDSDLPEVSSPVVFAPVQAAVAQYQDANTTVMIDPVPGTDPIFARIASEYIRNWETGPSKALNVRLELFREACITGTAISYNGRMTKKRKVRMMRSIDDIMGELTDDPDNMAEDQDGIVDVEKVKSKINKDPLKQLTYEDTIVDFDDNILEMVPLEELWVDPGAESFNGLTRDARDCIWVQYVPVQQVFTDFENSDDAFVIKKNLNAELIMSAGSVDEIYNKISGDYIKNLMISGRKDNLVCLLKYYNKMTDQYVILANDIIIRDGPLPYNHKQLPFSLYKLIPMTNSFYGLGFGTMLDTVQQQDELFLSLSHFLTERNANLPIGYSSDNGELEESLREIVENKKPLKAGNFIKMSSDDRIEPIAVGSAPFDLKSMRDELESIATKSTGVNSLMNSVPSANTAVRNNQMIQENSLLLIRMIVSNFSQGYVDAVSQILSIAKQLEPLSYIETVEDTTKHHTNPQITESLKQYRKIQTNSINEIENGSYEETEKGGTVELKPDITEKFDKLQVNIKIETIALASRQLQAQQYSETLDKALLVLGNPAFAENKIIMALFKDFLDKKGVNPKYFAYFEDENSDESDILADYQNEKMMAGEFEPPLAGMSQNHKMKHALLLMQLYTEQQNLNAQAKVYEQQLQQGMEQMDQGMGDQMSLDPGLIEVSQQLDQQLLQIQDQIERLSKHLAGDMQAKTDADMAAMTMVQPPAPSQPAPNNADSSMDPMETPTGEPNLNPMAGIPAA